MNPHRDCIEDGLLQAYLDAEVDIRERNRIMSHLSTCSSCRLRLEELQELNTWWQENVRLGKAFGSEIFGSENDTIQGDSLLRRASDVASDTARNNGASDAGRTIEMEQAWKRLAQRIANLTEATTRPTASDERDLSADDVKHQEGLHQKGLPKSGKGQMDTLMRDMHALKKEQKRSGKRIRIRGVNKMKKWGIVAAALLIVAGSLASPSVRDAAASMLQVFRVESLDTVKMTPQELDQVAYELESRLGKVDLSEYGQATVIQTGEFENGTNPFQYYDGDQLLRHKDLLLGLPQLPPSMLKGMQLWSYTEYGGHQVEFQLNVEKVNQLIQALGGEHLLPVNLDGEPFLYYSPQGYTLHWAQWEEVNAGEETGGTPAQEELQSELVQYLTLDINESPRVETSAEVDIAAVQEALVSLPFLSADVKRQLADMERLTNTLLMPELLESGGEIVDIQGTEGIYKVNITSVYDVSGVMQGTQENHELSWVRDGKLVRLSGMGMDRETFLEAARNIQWPE